MYGSASNSMPALYISIRGMFDHTMGGYDYTSSGSGYYDEHIYTIAIYINLFMLNILLLNFMVAILSTTYGDLLEMGSFLFKCKVYDYCERYVIAYKDDRYGELVIHAAPLNIFCVFLLPFTLLPANTKEPEEGEMMNDKSGDKWMR